MRRMSRTAAFALITAVLGAPTLSDETPEPFPDFTFKRVTVPKAGSGPRITVQIEPAPEPPPQQETPEPEQTATTGVFDWFWSGVSPSLEAAGPGRLEVAMRQIAAGPDVSAPRLDALQPIIERHQADILLATVGTQVSPALVLAVITVESSGNPDAVSGAGATGLMQLMPATAERFGVEDATDPADNIKGGVAYLDWLMGEFGGDPMLVLAAYNAGEGSVRRHEGVPPFAETRAYVPKVLAAWSVTRSLCKTPPELISDGCAFDLQGS